MLISKLTTQLTVALSQMTPAVPAANSSPTPLSTIPGPIFEPRVETLEYYEGDPNNCFSAFQSCLPCSHKT